MLSRRTFTIAGAASLASLAQTSRARQTPVASPVATAGDGSWRVLDRRTFDLEGQPCALSPDGAWIAGIYSDDNLVLWDTGALEPTVIPTDFVPEPAAIAWAPDSLAFAVSSSIITTNEESDLHCYDLASGTLSTLTPDNATSAFPVPDETGPRPNDLFPAWTPDSQSLVFARSDLAPDSARETTIASIPRTGGEAQVLATVGDRPTAIHSPLFPQANGSIYYTYSPLSEEDESAGIWRLEPDGVTTHLVQGDDLRLFTTLTAVATNDTGATLYASSKRTDARTLAETIQSFSWDVDGSDAIPREPLGPPDSPVTVHDVGSDGRTIAAVRWTRGTATIQLVDIDTGGSTILAELVGTSVRKSPTYTGFPYGLVNWAANNTVLVDIPGVDTQLITFEPA